MPSQALTATPFDRQDAAGYQEGSAGAAAEGDALQGADLAARIAEHHACARRALPYAVALLAKVAARHRARNAKLAVLAEAGDELAEALEAWLDEEERDLLPALRAATRAGEAAPDELRRMVLRHGELGLLLARVRWLADDFAVPAWAGRCYQALMEELQAFEQNLTEQLRLERSALGRRPGDARPPPEVDGPAGGAHPDRAAGEVHLLARAAGAPRSR